MAATLPPASASASSSTMPLPPPPSAPPAAPRTVVLTSVHPTDPTKQRSFEYRYFSPASASHTLAQQTRSFLDLPDSYFQPTPTELQQAHSAAVQRRQHLVDGPLLTRKLRDQQQQEHDRARARRWPHTRIRVRWPDRSLLEGVFPSSDKLVHLYEFVRLALRPDCREIPFVLYQTPPRTEYRRGDPQFKGKTLMDLDFTPSSAFYIKFEPAPSPASPAASSSAAIADAQIAALNDPAHPPPLVPELLEAIAELPAPPSFDPRGGESEEKGGESDEARKKREKEEKLRRLMGAGRSAAGAGAGAAAGGGSRLGSGGERGGVTPGWMKLGKDAHKK